MNEHPNWLFAIVGFFCLLGFLVSFILYFTNRHKSFSPRILAAILFCISYPLFGYLLYISELFRTFPHLYRTPVFMSLCVAPLTYIYVRSILEQAFRFNKWDFLFFIPAVLYTAQFIPFYLLPVNEKSVIVEKALASKSFGVREPEGLLPAGIGYILRMGYSLVLIVATYLLLIRWKRSDKKQLLKIHQNNEIFKWLVYLTIVLSSTFFILIIGYIFQVTRYLEQYRVATLTVTLTIFFICTYLLIKPNILYGLKGWLPLPPELGVPELTMPMPELVLKRQTISQDQGANFKQIIEEHFKKNQPYLKQRYTIKELSQEVEIPSYLISAFINQEYGKNFSEYVNENRIAFLTEFVRENPDALLRHTLEMLGQMSGFKSRAAFIAAVKRQTGKTPSALFGK
jgi:AraC-like DNA-binding protein